MKLIASFVAMRYIHENLLSPLNFFKCWNTLQSVLQDIINRHDLVQYVCGCIGGFDMLTKFFKRYILRFWI
jgi:hypothetical protein